MLVRDLPVCKICNTLCESGKIRVGDVSQGNIEIIIRPARLPSLKGALKFKSVKDIHICSKHYRMMIKALDNLVG